MNTRVLVVTWGTSRGAETYGYTVASLRENGQLVARCKGGGYDMRGTVFGDWLEKAFPAELAALRPADVEPYGCTSMFKAKRDAGLYGITWREDGSASLDGACGFESMRGLAEKMGMTVRLTDGGKNLGIITVEERAA